MRILFFNYEYPPLGGGAANATSYILREFSQIPDLEIDLVTSSIDSKYHLEKIEENIKIHRLPIGKDEKNLHFQSQKDIFVYAWKAYFFSRKLIKQSEKGNQGFNLSLSFFTVPCGFLSLVFKLQNKLPYIVSLRGSDVPGFNERFSLLYKIISPLIKIIWRKAEFVITASEDSKKLALKTSSEQKIGVICNGIDINDFKPNSEKKLSNKFIITPGASRVTSRKGIRYIIEALAKLVHRHPSLLLKIIGDGDEKENLWLLTEKLRLKNNVDFLGRIPHEKVAAYYQEANVFILPSLNEGMSNAMLEALASGLPIIATDTGGSKELVKNGANGFIIKMKDSDDIAEKMEKLISDKGLAKKMGEESRRLAETMSWNNVASEYLDLFKKIISK